MRINYFFGKIFRYTRKGKKKKKIRIKHFGILPPSLAENGAPNPPLIQVFGERAAQRHTFDFNFKGSFVLYITSIFFYSFKI